MILFFVLFPEGVYGLSADDVTVSGGVQVSLEGNDGNCSYRLIVTLMLMIQE